MEVDAELPENLGHLVEECLDSSRRWNIKLLSVGRVLNLTEHKVSFAVVIIFFLHIHFWVKLGK